MNIKQAETLSGVSCQNIRFYERQGLLSPDRGENGYRIYSDADIRTLKLIRLLRTLNMPLDRIHAILDERTPLPCAVMEHKQALQEQAGKLASAIAFCEELEKQVGLEQVDPDEWLSRMSQPQYASGLFRQWINDYKKLEQAEHKKTFTFIPDSSVTNAREFTDALLAYAQLHNLDIVICKEGMYPEFTIDGIEYRAERHYMVVQRVPVASIRCTAVHPEDFEPNMPEGKKKLLRILNLSWLIVPFLLMNLSVLISADWDSFLSTWEGWVSLAGIISLAAIQLYRHWLFTFNQNGKP